MKSFTERLYFFSDIDGTLLYKKAGKYTPNQYNTLMIQNYVGRGHAFVMATGRGYYDIQKIAKKLNIPLEYAIAYNGAFIYKNQEEIASHTLTTDQIELILNVAKEAQVKYNEVLLYVENDEVYVKTQDFLSSVRRLAFALRYQRKTRVWQHKLLAKLVKKNLRIPKLCFMCYRQEELRELENKFQAIFGDRLSIYRSSDTCLEICDTGVDKANAIRLIMQRENLLSRQVGFIGDSGNDVSAFKTIEHAYIMDHAVKKYPIRDIIAAPDVAEAISHFVDTRRTN